MKQVTLGRTGIVTGKNAFGALPIQRVTREYAAMLLRKAFDAGITFFDTARSYSDSEEKIGFALSNVREKLILATKTPLEGPGNQPFAAEDGLHRHLPVPQSQFLSQARGRHRPVRGHAGSKGTGKNPFYRTYKPSPERGGGGSALRPV